MTFAALLLAFLSIGQAKAAILRVEAYAYAPPIDAEVLVTDCRRWSSARVDCVARTIITVDGEPGADHEYAVHCTVTRVGGRVRVRQDSIRVIAGGTSLDPHG